MEKSRVIFKSPAWTACEMRDGSLIVTKNGKQHGVRLIGENAPHWIAHIKDAVAFGDTKEANMLCRAIGSEARGIRR